eukprot:Clim_evm22s201 gene=Clim_evmTU22s201
MSPRQRREKSPGYLASTGRKLYRLIAGNSRHSSQFHVGMVIFGAVLFFFGLYMMSGSLDDGITVPTGTIIGKDASACRPETRTKEEAPRQAMGKDWPKILRSLTEQTASAALVPINDREKNRELHHEVEVLHQGIATLRSPLGKLELRTGRGPVDNLKECLFYDLIYDGKPLVNPGSISLLADGVMLPGVCNIRYMSRVRTYHSGVAQFMYWQSDQAVIANDYVQDVYTMGVPSPNNGELVAFVKLYLRVYDHMAAVRMELLDPAKELLQERNTKLLRWKFVVTGPKKGFVILDRERLRPVTMAEWKGRSLSVSEVDSRGWLPLHVTVRFANQPHKILTSIDYQLKDASDPPRMKPRPDPPVPDFTPWQVFFAEDHPSLLWHSRSLIMALAMESSDPERTNEATHEFSKWIKPGKNVNINRFTEANVEAMLKIAQRFLCSYVTLGEGWTGVSASDPRGMRVMYTGGESGGIDFTDLVAKADTHGVKLIVWLDFAFFQDIHEITAHRFFTDLAATGVAGVRFGNLDHRDTLSMHRLLLMLELTLMNRIMVLVGGHMRNTGLVMKWPNLVVVAGTEDSATAPIHAKYSSAIPFCGWLGGPLDFQFTMDSEVLMKSMKSAMHQIALPVLLWSPIPTLFAHQHAVDIVDLLRREVKEREHEQKMYMNPQLEGGAEDDGQRDTNIFAGDSSEKFSYDPIPALSFWRNLPVLFDRSVLLASDINNYTAMARKEWGKQNWFVAMVNSRARPLEATVNFDFLDAPQEREGVWLAEIHLDAGRFDLIATDQLHCIIVPNSHLQFRLLSHGGMAMQMTLVSAGSIREVENCEKTLEKYYTVGLQPFPYLRYLEWLVEPEHGDEENGDGEDSEH